LHGTESELPFFPPHPLPFLALFPSFHGINVLIFAYYTSYAPYKYDLSKYVYVGSTSKDHIDPSIFTVLTAKSKGPGTPLADLIIFGERWDVAEGTFRPPVSACLAFCPPRRKKENDTLKLTDE
jgi:homogentisate 1,2-dioxygenase